MNLDISKEIIFQTARSGGKGGQNVNKVETMVEGYFHIRGSALLTDVEKERLSDKLQIMMVPMDGKNFFAADVMRSAFTNTYNGGANVPDSGDDGSDPSPVAAVQKKTGKRP